MSSMIWSGSLATNSICIPAFLALSCNNKAKFLEAATSMVELGYKIYATDSTAEFFKKHNIDCIVVLKAHQGAPNVLDIIDGKKVAFVVNLSDKIHKQEREEKASTDGYRIRRATVDNQIPLFTDLHLARAFVKALAHYDIKDLEIKSYNEYKK